MTRSTLHLVALTAVIAAAAGCSDDRGARPGPEGPPPIRAAAPQGAPKPSPVPAALPSPTSMPAAPAAPAAPAMAPPPAPAPSPSPKPSEPPWDPLKMMQDEQAKEASRKALVAEREEEIRKLESEIHDLESRRQTIFDPFLPPPQLPPEEEKAWEGLSGPQRVQRVDGQLAEARGRLAKAREALDKLKAGVY